MCPVPPQGVLRAPPFEGILRSTTTVRAFELAPQLTEAGLIQVCTRDGLRQDQCRGSGCVSVGAHGAQICA